MIVGIFGAGRNGSTLLMRLLDGSPGLWVYPIELNYLSVFAPRSFRGKARRVASKLISRLTLSGRSERDKYVAHLTRWAAYQLDELNNTYVAGLEAPLDIKGNPLQIITQKIGQSIQTDLLTFLDVVRFAYDDRILATNPLLVFKSIEVADLHRYRDLFPEMRFVHIVRDPYSNYASLKRTDMIMKQKPFWVQGGDIFRTQLESRWIPHARYIISAMKSEPERNFLVKYEELTEHPQTVVSRICRWLGVDLPADPALLTVLSGKRMKELPINPSQKGVKTPPRVVANMAEKFGYDDVLTERERDFILLRTHPLARQLGYFASEEARLPNRLNLLQKWFLPDKWELMNARPLLRLARALLSRRLYIYSKLLSPSLWHKA